MTIIDMLELSQINLQDMIEEIGEDRTKSIFSVFSCILLQEEREKINL